MPSIKENVDVWNNKYRWPKLGDEWSGPWGSPEAEWKFTIFPRVKHVLPTTTILEIGPGHGRWTQFLLANCARLTVVDVCPNCIEACQQRFNNIEHISFIVNDGISLDAVDSKSVDFVFSFDSLVHAEPEVISSYVRQFRRILKDHGSAFVHHSNLGEYLPQLPPVPSPDEHWRSRRMSAWLFREFCQDVDLACPNQELINWHDTGRLLDCFSWISNITAGAPGLEPSLIHNFHFMKEAREAAANQPHKEL